MAIKILIADDHQMFREGLCALLASEQDIEVAGMAADGRTTIELTDRLSPDIVVMDVGMPGLNGIEATRQIHARDSGTRVIALSMHADRRYVIGMLKAGAHGYLLKDGAARELVHAIRSVYAGNRYLCPAVTDVVLQDYLTYVSNLNSLSVPELTTREREVLQFLAEGRNTLEIAESLNISRKTVATHRGHIMEKLDLHSIAELTRYAIREGIIPL